MESIELQVTHVDIRPIWDERQRALRAWADVELGGVLAVFNLRITASNRGKMTVYWPDRPEQLTCPYCGHSADATFPHCGWCGAEKGRRGAYQPVVGPTCGRLRERVESAVLKAYCAVMLTNGKGDGRGRAG